MSDTATAIASITQRIDLSRGDRVRLDDGHVGTVYRRAGRGLGPEHDTCGVFLDSGEKLTRVPTHTLAIVPPALSEISDVLDRWRAIHGEDKWFSLIFESDWSPKGSPELTVIINRRCSTGPDWGTSVGTFYYGDNSALRGPRGWHFVEVGARERQVGSWGEWEGEILATTQVEPEPCECGGPCDEILAALEASLAEDHGPGCDGALNCTCAPPVQPRTLPRYFILLDPDHDHPLVVDRAFVNRTEAETYVERYCSRRSHLIFQGEALR